MASIMRKLSDAKTDGSKSLRRVRFSIGGSMETEADEEMAAGEKVTRDSIVIDFYRKQFKVETDHFKAIFRLLQKIDTWVLTESDNPISLKLLATAGWYYILGSKLLLSRFQSSDNYSDAVKFSLDGDECVNTGSFIPSQLLDNNNGADEYTETVTSHQGYASMFLSGNTSSVYNFLPAQATGAVLNLAAMKCLFYLDDQQSETSLDSLPMDELELYDETLGRIGEYMDSEKWINSCLTKCDCLNHHKLCIRCDRKLKDLYCHLECVCDKIEEDDELGEVLERLYDANASENGEDPKAESHYKEKIASLMAANSNALTFAQSLMDIISDVVQRDDLKARGSEEIIGIWQLTAAVECTTFIMDTLQKSTKQILNAGIESSIEFEGHASSYLSSVLPQDKLHARKESEASDVSEDEYQPTNSKTEIPEFNTAQQFLIFLDKVQRNADANNIPVSRGLMELQEVEHNLVERNIDDVDYQYFHLLLATFYTMCCDVINEGTTILEDSDSDSDDDDEPEDAMKDGTSSRNTPARKDSTSSNSSLSKKRRISSISSPLFKEDIQKQTANLYVQRIVASIKDQLTPVLKLVILGVMNRVRPIKNLATVDDYIVLLDDLATQALDEVTRDDEETMDDEEETAIVKASEVIKRSPDTYHPFREASESQVGVPKPQYGVVRIIHYLHMKFHEWLPKIIAHEKQKTEVHAAILAKCDSDSPEEFGDNLREMCAKYQNLEYCLTSFEELVDENILLRGLFYLFDNCLKNDETAEGHSDSVRDSLNQNIKTSEDDLEF